MEPIRGAVPLLAAIVFVPFLLAHGPGDASEVVTVVSPKNPLSTMSREQIADIFLGRTARFPDGRPAVALDQVEGSPAREEFYQQIAGKSPAQMKAYWSKIIFTGRGQPPPEVSGSSEMRRRVGENANTIGYIDNSAVDANVKVLVP
jgi:ABC-type phosphate transport system substrate-binding protein